MLTLPKTQARVCPPRVLYLPDLHCSLSGAPLTHDATKCIAAGHSFREYIQWQGQEDVLDVLANHEVRTWIDVSNLEWDRLSQLYRTLDAVGYGVGYVAVLRSAYIAVGQTHFAGFP